MQIGPLLGQEVAGPRCNAFDDGLGEIAAFRCILNKTIGLEPEADWRL